MQIIALQKHTHTIVCVGFPPICFLWNELYNCKHTHIAGTKGSQSNILLRKSIHPLYMSCCTEHSDTFTVNISSECLQTRLMPTATEA